MYTPDDIQNLFAYGWEMYLYDKYAEAFEAFERGEMCAAGELGQMYLNGWGVERDRQKAIEYFNQAAYAYYYGDREVEANADEALRYFRMAAEAGDVDATIMAGLLYLGDKLPFRDASIILPDRERGLYYRKCLRELCESHGDE